MINTCSKKLLVSKSVTWSFATASYSKTFLSSCKMFKNRVLNLQEASKDQVNEFLNSFDTVLTDCDGVLWIDNNAIPGSAEAMNNFRKLGKRIYYVTNNSTKIRNDFAEKAQQLGFIANTDEILSTSYLAAHYLKGIGFTKKVYILGSSGIAEELKAVGIRHVGVGPDPVTPNFKDLKPADLDPEVGAVVVGFDEHVSFPKFMKAASYLANPDCLFVATNTDERFPKSGSIVVPGTGTLVRAVETCAERKALVLGKPHEYVRKFLESCGLNPTRTLMIGDRLNTDIELGIRCGFQTLLVLTGVTSQQLVDQIKLEETQPLPDVVLPKLGDILTLVNHDKEVASVLRRLRTALPRGPLVNSELYTGWLTQWGGVRGASDTAAVARTLRYLLRHNVSFNFYMFHGGTNFEFTSGALGQPFLPHVTSYDYDAPLDEAGDPTPKYTAIRDLLTQFDPSVALTPAPLASRKGAYGAVRLRASLQLLSLAGAAALGSAHAAVRGPRLPSFEALRQRAGLVLYQTSVDFTEGTLFIESPRDLVLVYVDGVKQGQISRQKYQPSLKLTGSGNSTLSLLVENQGRVNYGASQNLHDFKGILSAVQLNNRVLTGPWNVTGYRLENVDSGPVAFDDSCDVRNGPVLYEGSLVLPPGETPLDTFINPTGWHKGLIWINGHNLGRYYLVGPQVTLYVPGAWLKPAPAVNRVQLLELVAAPAPPAQLDIQFIDHPILDNCTRPTA